MHLTSGRSPQPLPDSLPASFSKARQQTDRARIGEPPIVAQAKEKFGTLSFYVSGVPDAFRDDWLVVYQAASRRSGETCERCGAPGTLRGLAAEDGIGGWVHCYCDSCELQCQEERE